MKKLTFLLAVLAGCVASAFGQDLPPNPEPGKCYVRCTTPDVYETQTKQIVSKPAHKKLIVRPAEYKTVQEQIMIRPATKRYVYVPAKFRTVQKQVQVEDSYNALSVVPVRFASSNERIEVKPKSVGWEYRAASADCYSDNPADCEILCYVERPAEYRTVPTQSVAAAPTTTSTRRGGRVATIEVQELVEPARVEEIDIPAEFKTITRRVLVKDETIDEVNQPAQYAVVSVQNLVKKGGVRVWEEIECELTDYNVLPILYEFGSARITNASRNIIDEKLVKLMKERPNISVEITSHTDSRGSAASNLSLSEQRVRSVVNYLVNKGISRNRLVAKGYGESRLKNRCRDGVNCSEEEHAQNRRTEFRVISS